MKEPNVEKIMSERQQGVMDNLKKTELKRKPYFSLRVFSAEEQAAQDELDKINMSLNNMNGVKHLRPEIEKLLSERKKMVMDNFEKTEAEREEFRKSFGE
jgi:hypothetical protein